MAQRRERGIYTFATPYSGIKLSWHYKNEVRHYGCLDLHPCYDLKPFRVATFLDSDSRFYKDVEPVRYSEQDEPHYWTYQARMKPWGDQRKKGLVVGFFGYDKKAATAYVDSKIDAVYESGKFDSIHIVCKPFGGKPMICGVKSGKVTII